MYHMNKLTIWIVGGVIVIGGIAAFVFTRNADDTNTTVTSGGNGKTETVTTGKSPIIAVEACDVLTEAIAKTIVGDAAAKADLPASDVSTKDVSVSSCVYTAKIDPAAAVRISNTKGVNVLVRAAKTTAGSDSNKSQFGSLKPAGVQDVSGIGDAAFFNPTYGQLNVLKGGNWYILSNYSGTAAGGTLESNKVLAGALTFK